MFLRCSYFLGKSVPQCSYKLGSYKKDVYLNENLPQQNNLLRNTSKSKQTSSKFGLTNMVWL